MKKSVALCTYNGEEFIAEQLQSILKQNLPVDEIIICDDGSTDHTISIIKEFQKENSIIKLFENKNSLGVIKNFEKAINSCSNGIVFLSDQDDIWHSAKTKKIEDYFRENPSKKAVFHNLILYNNNQPTSQTIWDYIDFDLANRSRNNQDLLLYTAVIDNVLTGAACAIIKDKKISFSKEIPFMLHDFQILVHFANQNQLGTIDASLGYYRIHENQKVGAKLETSKLITDVKKKYFGEDLRQKLQILTTRLTQYSKYRESLPELKNIINLLTKDLRRTKKELLKKFSFFTRKRILIRWYVTKNYHTQIKDIFKI